MTEESNLVEHARRELEKISEDPEIVETYLKVIRAFDEMDPSGFSASIDVSVIHELLQFKNLSALTDDPDEWVHHTEEKWDEPGGVWQNVRNGEAFSRDGGKTYSLLTDMLKQPSHVSVHYEERAVLAEVSDVEIDSVLVTLGRERGET